MTQLVRLLLWEIPLRSQSQTNSLQRESQRETGTPSQLSLNTLQSASPNATHGIREIIRQVSTLSNSALDAVPSEEPSEQTWYVIQTWHKHVFAKARLRRQSDSEASWARHTNAMADSVGSGASDAKVATAYCSRNLATTPEEHEHGFDAEKLEAAFEAVWFRFFNSLREDRSEKRQKSSTWSRFSREACAVLKAE